MPRNVVRRHRRAVHVHRHHLSQRFPTCGMRTTRAVFPKVREIFYFGLQENLNFHLLP